VKALYPDLLCQAYSLGYFPMPDPETGKIVFLRPDPRAVLPLDGFHVSRSLRRSLAHRGYRVTFDQAFREVMAGCADREDTWITKEFFTGYTALHKLGRAHSVEVWKGEELVGGLYGVSLGGAFFAESKFHRERDASKVALFNLVEQLKRRGFALLEVQFLTPHLKTLGVIELSDEEYQARLQRAIVLPVTFLPAAAEGSPPVVPSP
jgi:leucyl/phenylalanyl-tRNA---protein transferase